MPKHIYMLVNDPGTVGGIQRVIAALSAGFLSAGYEVTVVGVRRPVGGRILIPQSDVTYIFPFPTSWVPAPLARLFNRYGMKFERALIPGHWIFRRRLNRVIRQKPGHIIAMDVFVAELSAQVSVPPGAVKLVQFHNSFDALSGTRDFMRLMNVVPRYDYLLALTEGDAVKFAESTPTTVLSMPNPLPFAPAPGGPSAGFSSSSRVVSIGRLEQHKGFGLLIDSWSALHPSTREGWSLRIIGEGEQREALESQIKRLGLSESVVLVGRSDDIQSELHKADLLVLASEYEGLPMVLLEAMSQSVACLATESSVGVAELLADGRGLLVPVGDRATLTTGIEELLRYADKRAAYAEAGYRKSKEFELRPTIDRWLRLLRAKGSTA